MSALLLGILNSQAAAGGFASDYEHLVTVSPSTGSSSLTISGLSAYASDYEHLEIRASLQATKNEVLTIRFNGDTGSSYRYGFMGADTTTTQAYFQTGPVTQIELGEAFARYIPGYDNRMTALRINILRAFGAYDKNFMALVGQANDYRSQVRLSNGKWENTAALSSITFGITSGTMESKTRFSIYGIRG